MARKPKNERAVFAPGKVILLGEHAVVHGEWAIAAPLRQGMTARLAPSPRPRLVLTGSLSRDRRRQVLEAFGRAAAACGSPPVALTLESDLPISVGLGSSASVSVACARGLLTAANRPLAVPDVLALAQVMEEVFHGTPSGVDTACSARNELIAFRRHGEHKRIEPLACPKPLGLVIGLAGPREPTGKTVAALRERLQAQPEQTGRLIREIGRVAEEGRQAILRGDVASLGDAMDVNHGLLAALRLSSEELDTVVHRFRAAGALGAKLTGAGGSGGAVVGLFEDPARAERTLRRRGIDCFSSLLPATRTP